MIDPGAVLHRLLVSATFTSSPAMETNTALRLPPVELEGENGKKKKKKKKRKEKDEVPFRPYMIPALYTTPESTPEVPPDYPSSFPPLSPYIVNHMRRGKRLIPKSFSQNDVICEDPASPPSIPPDIRYQDEDLTAAVADVELELGEFDRDDLNLKSAEVGTEIDDGKGVVIIGGLRLPIPASTPLGEFYDAFEEISVDGGKSQSSNQEMETEVRNTRLNLLMEIERRKQAEDSINNLKSEWHRIRDQISVVGGLTLPGLETDDELQSGGGNEEEFIELQQQVSIARFVGRCIGRGLTRAEVEVNGVESEIELKNSEIGQLWDRLKYYEATNHEMSKRNQEAIKAARQRRIKRKRRQKWIWSSIGVAVAVGAATVTLYYLPTPTNSNLQGGATNAKTRH